MVLNYIWIAFFLCAFAVALIRLIGWGDTTVFPAIIQATFDSSKTAFEISLGLTGVLSLWMGIMQIGEKGGIIRLFSKWLGPLLEKRLEQLVMPAMRAKTRLAFAALGNDAGMLGALCALLEQEKNK